MNTSCTSTSKSHIRKTTKLSTDICVFLVKFTVLLDIRWCYQSIILCTLSVVFHICITDAVKRRWTINYYIQLALGKTGDGRYIATGLSVWPWALLIVIENAIWIGNFLLRSLKGITRIWWTYLNVGNKDCLSRATTSVAVQCSCKPLMIMCCHHCRPREARIFHLLPMASGWDSTISF